MDADIAFAFIGADLILKRADAFCLTAPEAAALEAACRTSFRVGGDGGLRAEALALKTPPGTGPDWAPEGYLRVAVRSVLSRLGQEEAQPLLKALALATWLDTARFCGRCGSALAELPEGDGDAGGRKCPSCGLLVFPRISPAVIVLVRKDGKALLAHNKRFPAGRFGLIAGFVEAGETVEDCLRRELLEEAGIEVEKIAYRYSQPWPFPDSLMLAYTAEWKAGEARPDGVEIGELGWFGPDELPEIPPRGSVARRLIDDFIVDRDFVAGRPARAAAGEGES